MEHSTFTSGQIVELSTFGKETIQVTDDVTIVYQEAYQEAYQEQLPQTPITPLTPNSTSILLTVDD
ncbi:3984_t:CDS:1, partial [Racocetra fulgida]